MQTPPIIGRGQGWVAIDKPAGLLSVPGRQKAHKDCALTRLEQQLGQDLHVVHRLDMDTSGILLFALAPDTLAQLQRQFSQRTVSKLYQAQVLGKPQLDQGKIDLPLICDWPNRPLQKVDYVHGKPSQTHWQVIKRHGATTSVTLTPLTGRSHQLRVHMKQLGHPILGDRFYNPNCFAERLHLHACVLEFTEPETGQLIELSSSPSFA